jgi:hypothetical protein
MKAIHTNTVKNINTQTIHFIDIQIQIHTNTIRSIFIYSQIMKTIHTITIKSIFIYS